MFRIKTGSLFLFTIIFVFMASTITIGILVKEVEGIKYLCDEDVLICTGDETDDEITGNDKNNIIYGWAGSDYLRGMGGDDVIFGGEGADTIIGDLSSEVFNETKYGKDVLIGGPNDDILIGYRGNDEIYGGQGDDWLRDFAPSNSTDINKFFGGEGNDLLVGGGGRDIFQCGEGMDVVVNLNKTKGDESSSDCEIVIQESLDYNVLDGSQDLFQFTPIDNSTRDLGKK